MTRHRHYIPPRRRQPLTDAEWDALLPFVPVRGRPSRPLRDARRRMDAPFRTAAAGAPWRGLPPRFGKPDTASRHFRRLAAAGLWGRPPRTLARPDAPPAPLAVERWVCARRRRAARPPGMGLLAPAKRLGFLSAPTAPPHMLPKPGLSENVHRRMPPVPPVPPVLRDARERGTGAIPPGFLGLCRRLVGFAGRRRRIPRRFQSA